MLKVDIAALAQYADHVSKPKRSNWSWLPRLTYVGVVPVRIANLSTTSFWICLSSSTLPLWTMSPGIRI